MDKGNENRNENHILSGDDERLWRLFSRNVIYWLIANSYMDEEKIENYDYLEGVLGETREIWEEFMFGDEVVVIIDRGDMFFKEAIKAYESGNKIISIILFSTAIELKINRFFRKFFMDDGIIEDKEVTEILRKNSIYNKLTWLFELVTGDKFPPEYRKEILKITQMRNSIVHDKLIPMTWDEKSPELHIEMEPTLKLFENLKKYFDKIFHENDPTNALVEIAVEVLENGRTQNI